MKPVVQRLILKRFRSFAALSTDFANVTYVVGKNGAGKSNFIDAFAFLTDAVMMNLEGAFNGRGGLQTVRHRGGGSGFPPNLGMRFEFGPVDGKFTSAEYAFEIGSFGAREKYGYKVLRERCRILTQDGKAIWFDRNERSMQKRMRGSLEAKVSAEPRALLLTVVAGTPEFLPLAEVIKAIRVYSLEPRKLHHLHDPDGSNILKKDGSNAASILQDLQRTNDPSSFEAICELLSQIVPGITNVAPRLHGNRMGIEFHQQWGETKPQRFDASSMSDGTLSALGLLLAVYQRSNSTVLVIEEPETTMYPGALGVLRDAFNQAASNSQVIVATHSPQLLTAIRPRPENLRVLYWRHGMSAVVPFTPRRKLRSHLLNLGDLLAAGALEDEPADEAIAPNSEMDRAELFPRWEDERA